MPSATSDPQIILIGAGLSGLATSLFLTRLFPTANIKIYEVRPADQPSAWGTINLTPNALRVLDHIGIYETIKPQGYNFDNLNLVNHKFEYLAEIPIANVREFEYQSLRIERRLIHAALLEKAKEQPRIEIIHDSKCTSVIESEDSVTVTFENGISATGDLLIACDGIHSIVRKFFLKDPALHEPKYKGQISIGGFISDAEIQKYNTKKISYPLMMFAPEAQTGANFVIWPYDNAGEQVTFFTSIVKEEEEEGWKSYTDKNKLKQVLLDLYNSEDSPWNEMVKKTVELSDPEKYRFWAFYLHTIPEKFYSDKGRMIMIGDAAHAMPPAGGQGAAMAFEDSETLAYSLALAYTKFQASENREGGFWLGSEDGLEVLGKWSDHRIVRMNQIQELNQRMQSMRKASTGTTSSWSFTIKVWAIWIMGLLGILGRTRRDVNNYHSKNELVKLFGEEDVAKVYE